MYGDNNYKAVCLRVIDGDTLHIEVDLGLRVKRTLDVRLVGIDTPEVTGATREAGLAATEYLKTLLFDNGAALPLVAQFMKGKSFDRWLAKVYLEKHDEQGSVVFIDVQEMLIKAGYAKEMVK